MNVRQVIPRDAIPSVDAPEFGATYDGDGEDDVVVLDTCDPARAYPVRYLNYHEIVNDVVDGDPVAVTWCPLCGSAVVYDRRVNGQTLEFGVSGKLADDDLVMYDRQTESEWKQSLGECIRGELQDTSLTVRPASLGSWQEFRETYPDGVVLQAPGGESEAASDGDEPASIDYDESPYDEYVDGEGFGLAAHRGTSDSREWNRDDLAPKTVVLGVEQGADAVGYPLPDVRDAGGVVTDHVGDRSIVVFATADGIHAYEDPGYEFDLEEGDIVGDGTSWNVATGRSADGRRLERVPSRRLFAFAWQDDHGEDAFYHHDA
ncbi:DUF3179 domain-containing (seleno)protein [Halobacterium rubrum]|uniref:DUF3179 domain-containing (seleno)protein n=1 Tax=Halobacterium TaxID=2239 RepID=UPI001F41455B|nr:DUF3179 domain-containing protein [Halobacterium rubrum]MDH5020302.1 DUF3179 domain-containing protein [Halobacterium rubrum]